jgi:hypothetical protein
MISRLHFSIIKLPVFYSGLSINSLYIPAENSSNKVTMYEIFHLCYKWQVNEFWHPELVHFTNIYGRDNSSCGIMYQAQHKVYSSLSLKCWDHKHSMYNTVKMTITKYNLHNGVGLTLFPYQVPVVTLI